MFTLLASRGLASLTAIVSTIALWFAMSFTSSSLSATPFSKVLSELQRADSMQLKIVRDGNSADVWIRSPGLVRYQESAQNIRSPPVRGCGRSTKHRTRWRNLIRRGS